MRLPSSELQGKAAKEIIAKDMNIANTRQIIAKMLANPEQKTGGASIQPIVQPAGGAGFILGKTAKTLHLAAATSRRILPVLIS